MANLRRAIIVLLTTVSALLFVASNSLGAPPPKSLTVTVQGAGSVTLDPPGGAYPRGTAVTMTAISDPGWNFDHWEGPTIDGSTSNPQVITVYNNYNVLAVFKAPTGVDVHRRRDVTIRVEDGLGAPVSDVDVSVNLQKRAFPFGVAVTNHLLANSRYRSFVRQNSPKWWDWAVFGNEAKWYHNEAAQDIVSYQDADAMADLLISWGFTLRGHTLFWAVDEWVQQWVKDLPTTAELQQQVDERLTDAVTHFAGTFVHWDVNNEMVHGSFFETNLGPGTRTYLHNQTAALDPGVLITVNDYNVVAGGWDTQAFKDLVVQLESDGAVIDILGVQCHMTTDDTMEEVVQRIDSVAELGYPIWVTEFDIEEADEAVRAQYLEDFYRTVFGHPAIEGIMLWGFWAGDHWRGPDAVLVNQDWTLNQVGQRFAALMDEWWTDETGLSDSVGEFAFNGMHGTYSVTLTQNGGAPEVHTIDVDPGTGVQTIVLTLGTGAPVDDTPPAPDPAEWDVPPTPVGDTAISMLATEATDASGVEYYFANLTDPSHDSGWLDTPFFTDIGVSVGVQYTYAVATRDRAVTPNVGDWSPEASATTLADANIIENGGFEYGYPDGWTGFGGASILSTTDESASGSYSCLVGNRTETWKGVTQDLLGKLTPGSTYDISAWFLLANSPSEPVGLSIKQSDVVGDSYTPVADGTANDTTWTQVTGTFTLNAPRPLTGLSVFTEGPAVGVDVYVDDVELVEVGAPFCGDGTCSAGETQCDCPADCGAPPSSEAVCDDGVDEDCDGQTDCADADCAAAPACLPACDNDGVCESGEDCDNCSGDCAGVQVGKPSSRYCCGNGVAESAEGDGTICDGNY